jgi:uncharacterized membrane protein YczE
VKEAPRLRGGLVARTAALFAGLVAIAVAIVILLESQLGLAPWDVFHLGVAAHTPLSIGWVSVVVGLVVLLVAWAVGARPGFGTVANAVVIGVTIEILLAIDGVAGLSEAGLPLRGGLLVAGVVLFGVGSAFYIGAGLGAGPRDSLMLALSARTGQRIGLVRGSMEVAVLSVGFLLGGTVGVGTVAVALLLGPAVEASFWALTRLGWAERAPADQPSSAL